MRALTQLRGLLDKHGDKVERAIDKAALTVDRRTKGQHRSKIDVGVDRAKRYVRGTATGRGPATRRRA